MHFNIVNKAIPSSICQTAGFMVTHNDPIRFSKAGGRTLYGFIHVLTGKLEYQFVDDQSRICTKAKQTIYIPKGCRYISIYPSEPTTVAIYQFDLLENSAHLPPQAPFVFTSNVEHLFRDFTDPSTELSPLLCAARCYELLDILLRAPSNIPKKYRRLQPALEYIEHNLALNESSELYAQMCDMSPSGFRRSFKEYVGMTPVEYRNYLRLVHAKKLLSSGEYSVAAAAQQSGFNNLSFFYRMFRNQFGICPGNL